MRSEKKLRLDNLIAKQITFRKVELVGNGLSMKTQPIQISLLAMNPVSSSVLDKASSSYDEVKCPISLILL